VASMITKSGVSALAFVPRALTTLPDRGSDFGGVLGVASGLSSWRDFLGRAPYAGDVATRRSAPANVPPVRVSWVFAADESGAPVVVPLLGALGPLLVGTISTY
jgi:hypothetical protein